MDMDGPVVARVVRDPEVYITVLISDLRPDVAQYLAYSFVTTRTEVYILSH